MTYPLLQQQSMQVIKNLKLKVKQTIQKICKLVKKRKPAIREVIESVDTDECMVRMLVEVNVPDEESLGLEILFEKKAVRKEFSRRCKSFEVLTGKNIDMRSSCLVLA